MPYADVAVLVLRGMDLLAAELDAAPGSARAGLSDAVARNGMAVATLIGAIAANLRVPTVGACGHRGQGKSNNREENPHPNTLFGALMRKPSCF